VLDDYQRVALGSADFAPLSAVAQVVVFHDHLGDESALVERLADVDAVVAMRERTAFPASVLEGLPRLGLLVTTGMVNAAIDLESASRLGITVCGTRAAGSATPELVWALLMALARGIPAEDAAIREGRWQVGIGRELAGSTLGLLGLGRLGQAMAHYAQAFGMNVIAWSQNLTAERAQRFGVEAVSKAELFERADIVSVHVRLSDRTEGIVGADELRLLGPDGLLVNTSRGPVVDEAALVDALENGWIAGAGLDVFGTEPLPAGHPLLRAPNTVLTPHIGYVSREAYAVFYSEAVEDTLAWRAGAPVRVLT
jgi:phosphoglycerate dehydrogenase-like enzyme